MTPDRSEAYGRVMKTLEDLGPSKLHELERRRVRNAADTLLFAASQDLEAFDAVADIDDLVRALIDSGRWHRQTAAKLADDVTSCGPDWAEVPAPVIAAA